MSVSNYLFKTEYGCRYSYQKLKNEIYLVSEDHLKDIIIDNGVAYISGLTETPLKIEGFNIEFKEETSLDERYKFQKTLTISVNGIPDIVLYRWRNLNPDIEYLCERGNKYVKQIKEECHTNNFENFYLIIMTEDNTPYIINIDFPSKSTYTYNLSDGVNQTDFTFTSLSNFPTLELKDFTPPDYGYFCGKYNITKIEKLELIEKNKIIFSDNSEIFYTTDNLKTVEYLGNSFSFQEIFDGDKITTNLEFQIGFDEYKTSWHYNLLEFNQNRYVAVITLKDNPKKIYAGLEFGLYANYSINASSQDGQTNSITIALSDISNYGLISGDYAKNKYSTTHWRYISKIKNYKAYECTGRGNAKYLLQEECNYLGNPTGNYKVLSGYENKFYFLNIIGTFSDVQEFISPDCN